MNFLIVFMLFPLLPSCRKRSVGIFNFPFHFIFKNNHRIQNEHLTLCYCKDCAIAISRKSAKMRFMMNTEQGGACYETRYAVKYRVTLFLAVHRYPAIPLRDAPNARRPFRQVLLMEV